ncbi:mycothiol synthase [Paenibacillus rhizosphaerae]|uniref:Mycothiol synthase n=1 Tax=Paenibacillus rhizosphaerae TaxID=297318 RepID=A0A839TNH4_9BACL|nr:GNAT family N-acetyltransferase [Paenibacillus rhizosphaerae]MBB3128454.1 mycothiol synthase [Paenibacillus rhizosphaerae]
MESLQPQLSMLYDDLTALPALELPGGFTARTFRKGDEIAWEAIIRESFANEEIGYGHMTRDPEYRPERVWFICDGDAPVATAAAWHKSGLGKETGYLHMVGLLHRYAGRALGAKASLAAMHGMVQEGRRRAVLDTDDFRIPAIKTYLNLGYIPRLVHENQLARWRAIAAQLGEGYRSRVARTDLNLDAGSGSDRA